MFKSKRIACYLNGFAGHGEDPDNKELKLVFQISPVPYALAMEIDARLADRLFRIWDGQAQGAGELTKASFSNLQIPMQHITFDELPDADSTLPSVRVENSAISNLRASKAPVGGDSLAVHRLEFDVVIPMEKQTMRLVEKYYKAVCFLTMEEVQRKLEERVDETEKAVGESLQDAADQAETPKKRKRRDGKAAAAGDEQHEPAAVN